MARARMMAGPGIYVAWVIQLGVCRDLANDLDPYIVGRITHDECDVTDVRVSRATLLLHDSLGIER
jgi:hypothetical protein